MFFEVGHFCGKTLYLPNWGIWLGASALSRFIIPSWNFNVPRICLIDGVVGLLNHVLWMKEVLKMGTADQMYHFPFQKLCFVSQASPSSGGIILGATGPHICSFNAATGQLLSRWPHNDEEKSGDEGDHDAANEEERSAKRRKLSSEDSDTSIEIVAQRVKGTRRKPKLLNERIPNVSNLVATSDGSLVIAITTDDKCMRVFRCSANGRLHVQSER